MTGSPTSPPGHGPEPRSGAAAGQPSRWTLLLALGIPAALIAAGLALVLPALWRTAAPDLPHPRAARSASPPAPALAPAPALPSAQPAAPAPLATQTPAASPPPSRGPVSPAPLDELARSVTPATAWLQVPAEATLTRIGFGSCLHQGMPQPIWRAVLAARPELFLMIGDNVYGDIRSDDARELAAAYRAQLAHPEFAAARAAMPMLGVWDDHDYGQNDGGASFTHRAAAAALFRGFWQRPAGAGSDGGVQLAQVFGPPGRRVQVILLDTRSFRSAFVAQSGNSRLFGKYGPDLDPTKTMLGEAQWRWLAAELEKPAEVRLLVSSIQVLSEGHAFERWGNLPLERDRLIHTIEASGANGVILLSGDRHIGAIYNRPIAAGRILIEITSSSLNRSYGPARDVPTAELVSDLHHAENFGWIEIDWVRRRVALALRGIGGETLDGLVVRLSDLGLPARGD